MKYLISLDPPAEAKNQFEKNPKLQKQLADHLAKVKPVAGWFSWRYGFLVVEANTTEELGKIITPINHIFQMDVRVGPAIPLEEFGKAIQAAAEASQGY